MAYKSRSTSSLLQVASAVRRYPWCFVIPTLLVVAVLLIIATRSNPRYEAEVYFYRRTNMLLIDLIKDSESLIQQLRVPVSEHMTDDHAVDEMIRLLRLKSPNLLAFNGLNSSTEEIRSQVARNATVDEVVVVPGLERIRVGFTSDNPLFAREVVNTLVEIYLSRRPGQIEHRLTQSMIDLENIIKAYGDQLENLEQEKLAFEIEHGQLSPLIWGSIGAVRFRFQEKQRRLIPARDGAAERVRSLKQLLDETDGRAEGRLVPRDGSEATPQVFDVGAVRTMVLETDVLDPMSMTPNTFTPPNVSWFGVTDTKPPSPMPNQQYSTTKVPALEKLDPRLRNNKDDRNLLDRIRIRDNTFESPKPLAQDQPVDPLMDSELELMYRQAMVPPASWFGIGINDTESPEELEQDLRKRDRLPAIYKLTLAEEERELASLDQQLNEAQIQLDVLDHNIPSLIEYQKLKLQIKSLKHELADYDNGQLEVWKALVAEFSDRAIEFDFSSPCLTAKNQFLEKWQMRLSLGVCVSLLAGVSLAFYKHTSDRTITADSQLTHSLGLPLLGTVSEIISKREHRKRCLINRVILPVRLAASVVFFAIIVTTLSLNAKSLSRRMDERERLLSVPEAMGMSVENRSRITGLGGTSGSIEASTKRYQGGTKTRMNP